MARFESWYDGRFSPWASRLIQVGAVGALIATVVSGVLWLFHGWSGSQSAAPAVRASVTARMVGAFDTPFTPTLMVAYNGVVDVRVEFRNQTAGTTTNVRIDVAIPPALSASTSGLKILNASNPSGAYVSSVRSTPTGFTIDVGSYTAGSNAFLVFPVSLRDPGQLDCGENTLPIRALFRDSASGLGQTNEARLTYRGLKACS